MHSAINPPSALSRYAAVVRGPAAAAERALAMVAVLAFAWSRLRRLQVMHCRGTARLLARDDFLCGKGSPAGTRQQRSDAESGEQPAGIGRRRREQARRGSGSCSARLNPFKRWSAKYPAFLIANCVSKRVSHAMPVITSTRPQRQPGATCQAGDLPVEHSTLKSLLLRRCLHCRMALPRPRYDGLHLSGPDVRPTYPKVQLVDQENLRRDQNNHEAINRLASSATSRGGLHQ